MSRSRNQLYTALKAGVPPALLRKMARLRTQWKMRRRSGDLSALALLYGTDKNGAHFYTQHYQRYFEPLRNHPLRVLEIGVGGYSDLGEGASSLRMWKRFFPKAHIVGIDLFDKSHFSEDRITVLQCDQTDAPKLNRISLEYGPFDIIIDDGSHRNEHVISTFQTLFPLLKSPGFYAVEDLQTAYWPSWGAVKGETSMDFLRSLTDGLNYVEDPEETRRPFDNQITEIAFFHNLCMIRKGDNSEPSNLPQEIARERAALSASRSSLVV